MVDFNIKYIILYVYILDDYECDVGSTIYLKVNSLSDDPCWHFQNKKVDSECDPKIAFEKKNAVIGDSGRYIGTVNNIVKYRFNVIIHGMFSSRSILPI